MDKYSAAANCKMLRAPKLNAEVKSVMRPNGLKKDSFQNQLGSSITALRLALSELLKKAKEDSKYKNLISLLADSGRLFTDLHYKNSLRRRSFILYSLVYIVKNVADHSEVDSLLFGENFSDCFKSEKATQKIGKYIARTKSSHTGQTFKYKKDMVYPRGIDQFFKLKNLTTKNDSF